MVFVWCRIGVLISNQKSMAKYVDGFVLVVPKKNLAAYKKMAKDGGKTLKKFGALDYKECLIDDKKPPHAALHFEKMTKAKPDEVVIFSFITFRSKAHRNQVNKKVMAYFEKKYTDPKDMAMPFDMKRMAYAGFTPFVDMGA